ncbi:hypothetical protein OROMI_006763 [Orobanche minor]
MGVGKNIVVTLIMAMLCFCALASLSSHNGEMLPSGTDDPQGNMSHKALGHESNNYRKGITHLNKISGVSRGTTNCVKINPHSGRCLKHKHKPKKNGTRSNSNSNRCMGIVTLPLTIFIARLLLY